MNILIVYSHPEAKSFNSTLKESAVDFFISNGHEVVVSNLYEENFDPVERAEHYKNRRISDKFDPLTEQRNAYKTDTLHDDVNREIERLEWCNLLILQFPLWWHQQPAILKGWFDRVFIAGGLYTSKMRYDQGYFKGKQAICSVTSGAPGEAFTSKGRAGGDIDTLLYSMNYSLYYMGFTVLPAYLVSQVQGVGFATMNADENIRHLDLHKSNWVKHLTELENINPLSFPGWNDWNEHGAEK